MNEGIEYLLTLDPIPGLAQARIMLRMSRGTLDRYKYYERRRDELQRRAASTEHDSTNGRCAHIPRGDEPCPRLRA